MEQEEEAEQNPTLEVEVEAELPPPVVYNWKLLSAVLPSPEQPRPIRNRNAGNIIVTLKCIKAFCGREYLQCKFCPKTVPIQEKEILFSHMVKDHVNMKPAGFFRNGNLVLNPLLETRKKIKVTATEINIAFLKTSLVVNTVGLCPSRRCNFESINYVEEKVHQEMKEHIMAHHTYFIIVEETERNFSLFDDL
jgi:hypothetical protein